LLDVNVVFPFFWATFFTFAAHPLNSALSRGQVLFLDQIPPRCPEPSLTPQPHMLLTCNLRILEEFFFRGLSYRKAITVPSSTTPLGDVRLLLSPLRSPPSFPPRTAISSLPVVRTIPSLAEFFCPNFPPNQRPYFPPPPLGKY